MKTLFLRPAIILLILSFSGLYRNVFPVNYNVDSLAKVISGMDNDTLKFRKQVLLIRELANKNPELALKECRKAIQLANKIDYYYGIVDINYELSFVYKQKSDFDSSLFYINKFITLSESLKDNVRLAKGYVQFGNIVQRKGDLEIAKENFDKSRVFYEKTKDTLGLISVYNALGIIARKTSQYHSAVTYYLNALQLSEKLDYKAGIGPSLNNLGIVYYSLKDFENARKYSLQSIEINKNLNKLDHVSMAYTNLGSIALDEGDFYNAERYYTMAIEIGKIHGNKIMLYNSYINLGIVFQKKGNLKMATEKYDIAYREFKRINSKVGIVSALMNKSSVFEASGNDKQALALLDTCLIIASSPGDLEMRKDIYEKVYLIYSKKGDYKNAFHFQSIFLELSDSINVIDQQKSVAELTLKYEKKKDQARILSLENENLEKDLNLRKRTNQRNIYLLSGLALVLLAFSITGYFIHKGITDKKFAEQKILQLEEEKRLLAAKSIVEGQEEERKRIAKELHDGLGVLLSAIKMQFTSIKSFLPENKPVLDKATRLLEQATGDVRRISHNMMPGLLTRFGLFEAVEDLFENLNDIEGLQASLTITGEQSRLPENMEIMIYRIIQEMVNNTIKHANASDISFNITRIEQKIHFIYYDNGKGFDIDQSIQNKSIGINSIMSRVNYLGGNIEFISAPGKGTQIVFDLAIPESS